MISTGSVVRPASSHGSASAADAANRIGSAVESAEYRASTQTISSIRHVSLGERPDGTENAG
jgi:hypothetical protein